MKRFNIDKVFHFTEADIKHMRVFSPPLSSLFFIVKQSISDKSFSSYHTIKTEQSIIYEVQLGCIVYVPTNKRTKEQVKLQGDFTKKENNDFHNKI